MDQLGTQRSRSADFVPTSANDLLAEFHRPLPCFSLVQGDEMQNPGFMRMMLRQFELVFANLQLGGFSTVCKTLTALRCFSADNELFAPTLCGQTAKAFGDGGASQKSSAEPGIKPAPQHVLVLHFPAFHHVLFQHGKRILERKVCIC